MLHKISVAILLVSLCTQGFAQVPFPGSCPDVKIPEDFDLDAYMGIWYEYSRYPFVFEIGKKCACAHYKNICNGSVSVVNEAINVLTGNPSNVTGEAKVLAPGQLAVKFNRFQNVDKPNYQVLGTDYKTYSVVYSCSNIMSITNTKVIWILTRERIPSRETVDAAQKIIEDNNLSLTFLMETTQDSCNNNCQPIQNGVQEACAASTEGTAEEKSEKKKNEF